jgi:hypothetical protein
MRLTSITSVAPKYWELSEGIAMTNGYGAHRKRVTAGKKKSAKKSRPKKSKAKKAKKKK